MAINLFKWFKSEKVDSKEEEKDLIIKRLRKEGEIMLEWLKRQDGASAVEYALMITLVGGMVVAAVALFGGQVKDIFQSVTDIVSLPH